jgi:hypothetical protein
VCLWPARGARRRNRHVPGRRRQLHTHRFDVSDSGERCQPGCRVNTWQVILASDDNNNSAVMFNWDGLAWSSGEKAGLFIETGSAYNVEFPAATNLAFTRQAYLFPGTTTCRKMVP